MFATAGEHHPAAATVRIRNNQRDLASVKIIEVRRSASDGTIGKKGPQPSKVTTGEMVAGMMIDRRSRAGFPTVASSEL